MEQPGGTAVLTPAVRTSRVAMLPPRVIALAIDGLVLFAIGLSLGSLVGERIAPVGTPARLIGLLVMVPYLGVLGSEIGNGQTLGKRLLGLRVVDANGRPLPLGKALPRAALLSLPWIFDGMRFGSLGSAAPAMLWAGGVIVFGLGGAIVWTAALNIRTRQALHDLLAGSFVIEARGIGLPVPVASTRRPLVASIVWIALVAVVTMTMALAAPRLFPRAFPPELLESAMAIPGASSVEIKQTPASGPGSAPNALVAVFWFRGPQGDTRKAADQVAAAILEHHPDAAAIPTVTVKVVRGWDVGIARRTTSQTFAKTPAEWQAELRGR